jgi:hypothetical protein
MTRYTVTYVRTAMEALALLWINASDQQAVTRAGDAIDQLLREGAQYQGIPVGPKLRQLIIAPLVVEFTVEEADRMVTIWSVRHVGELSNGK